MHSGQRRRGRNGKGFTPSEQNKYRKNMLTFDTKFLRLLQDISLQALCVTVTPAGKAEYHLYVSQGGRQIDFLVRTP